MDSPKDMASPKAMASPNRAMASPRVTGLPLQHSVSHKCMDSPNRDTDSLNRAMARLSLQRVMARHNHTVSPKATLAPTHPPSILCSDIFKRLLVRMVRSRPMSCKSA